MVKLQQTRLDEMKKGTGIDDGSVRVNDSGSTECKNERFIFCVVYDGLDER